MLCSSTRYLCAYHAAFARHSEFNLLVQMRVGAFWVRSPVASDSALVYTYGTLQKLSALVLLVEVATVLRLSIRLSSTVLYVYFI